MATEPNTLHALLSQTLHEQDLCNQQAFWKMKGRTRARFIVKAMKRARSNHPHNARWKPLLKAWTVAKVAEKLEEQ